MLFYFSNRNPYALVVKKIEKILTHT